MSSLTPDSELFIALDGKCSHFFVKVFRLHCFMSDFDEIADLLLSELRSDDSLIIELSEVVESIESISNDFEFRLLLLVELCLSVLPEMALVHRDEPHTSFPGKGYLITDAKSRRIFFRSKSRSPCARKAVTTAEYASSSKMIRG
ncbi:hypothetical protein BLOT_009729 [Blomia tropicalis]|nr:hypothetical protein BLOT_009729 [Blomia tropicalis]